MKLYSFKGCGKDYFLTIKMCKLICIYIHGRINWYFFFNGIERSNAIERIYKAFSKVY